MLGSALWLSVLAVLGLWVSNGGVQGFADGGGAATTTGRLTGLVSADLLLVQVVLMARVPWVERTYGHDRLARWHRVLGFSSVWLMIAHIVLITLGYAQAVRAGVLGQAWELVTAYPGMLLATAATVALVGVTVVSVRAARRRMRYESWHLLHLYAYLGVGLALPHELWTGADFVRSAPARAYWWTLYAVAVAAVLTFRVGLPGWRSWYHQMRVVRVTREGHGAVSVTISGRRLDRLPVRAGQFLLWRFLDGPGWTRAHPYSLSAAPHAEFLRITVQDVGDGSAKVAALRRGTRVLVEGPYGRLTAERRVQRRVLLLAAGIGITPLRALLDELAFAPGEVTLLYRVRRRSNAVFRDELDQLAQHRGLELRYLVGHRRAEDSFLPVGEKGNLSDRQTLQRLVPDVDDCDVYLCGPPPWMAAARDAVLRAGTDPDRVHTEEFAW